MNYLMKEISFDSTEGRDFSELGIGRENSWIPRDTGPALPEERRFPVGQFMLEFDPRNLALAEGPSDEDFNSKDGEEPKFPGLQQ
jgi:hypothetical protein